MSELSQQGDQYSGNLSTTTTLNSQDEDTSSNGIKLLVELLNLTCCRFPSMYLARQELNQAFLLSQFISDDDQEIILDEEYIKKIGQILTYTITRVFKEKKCFHKKDIPTIWIEARKLFTDYCQIDQCDDNSDFRTRILEILNDGDRMDKLFEICKVSNIDCLWKLYCEELWWRLYEFVDFETFSSIPTKKKEFPGVEKYVKQKLATQQLLQQDLENQQQQNQQQENPQPVPLNLVQQEEGLNSTDQQQQPLESDNISIDSSSTTDSTVGEKKSKKELKRIRNKLLKEAKKQKKPPTDDSALSTISEEVFVKRGGFFMNKACLDNVRYFVWGYYNAFEPNWYTKDILDLHFNEKKHENPYGRFKNIILLDLDNVGQSIFLLKERNFDYGKDCLLIGVAGPKYSTSIKVSEEVLRERGSSLHFVKIRLSEQNLSGMNSFEKYLFDFYDKGYFKKFKDAADYLLGAIAGALHRITDLHTRIFIVSKDDGLRHIQKSLITRGRASHLVTSQESLMYTLDNYLFTPSEQWNRLTDLAKPTLTKFEQLNFDELTKSIEPRTVDYKQRLNNIDIQQLSDSIVSEEEKIRVYSSTTGVVFGREIHEKIMGDYIYDYYSNVKDRQVYLENIRIKGRRFSYQGWEGIVKSLALPHVNITYLQEIDIRGCRIEDKGAIELFQILESCSNLTLIDVGACFLTDKSAPAIAKYLLSEKCILQTLDLRWNSIGAKGAKIIIDTLEHNKSLTSISFRLNPIQSVGANYVIRKSLECSAGERYGFSIDCRQTSKSDDLGFVFSDMIESVQNAKRAEFPVPFSLDLSSVEMYPEGTIHLSNFLYQVSEIPIKNRPFEITKLALDYNNLGDLGVEYLSRGLMNSSSILILTIGRNLITEKGAICLAQVLKKNQTLTYLDLQKNKVGELGGFSLAEALRTNQTLTYLNLKSNYIGDLGALAFANAFSPTDQIFKNTNEPTLERNVGEFNDTLINLDLTNNRITYLSARHLMKSIERNTSLSRLNMSNNPDMLSDSIVDLTTKLYARDTSEYQDLNCGSWWLEISDCSLKDKAMETFEKFTKKPISHFLISGNVLGDFDYCEEMRSVISTFYPHSNLFNANTSLVSLNCVFENLLQSLICVDLRNCSLGDDDLSLLFSDNSILLDKIGNRKPSNIYHLNLSGNHFTPRSGVYLRKLLEYNTSITCLVLNYNKVGDLGLKEVVDSLYENNHTLTSLSIRNNDITDAGVLFLSEYMKKMKDNAVLGFIDLESNMITDKGAEYLGEGISTENYDAIHFITLERNNLTSTGNAHILQMASRKVTSDINSGIIQTIHLAL
ncbi:predicted protein [Naegleria gruberi]|uniref:Predicted protein n=1 Tax=Naegleria gruberi TaxID=5762 RepID=D2V2V0_NAEGR|nr:uncharacterized protein NAEGRDRAFT_46256 [Naegleria gruberi]EFC49123.1 predicted protein [Naegleria gruberi]|eukprot:XP_002681867.1 predicted protein [Naegleria gruberi strain NEG-M]